IQRAAVATGPQPLGLSKPDKVLKVTGTSLLQDQNGDAVVVVVKNESKQTIVNSPILVDLRDAKGKSIYKNNTPGLDPSLNHLSLIQPGQSFTWVNDQIQPNGIPKSANVTTGPPEASPPNSLPELPLTP